MILKTQSSQLNTLAQPPFLYFMRIYVPELCAPHTWRSQSISEETSNTWNQSYMVLRTDFRPSPLENSKCIALTAEPSLQDHNLLFLLLNFDSPQGKHIFRVMATYFHCGFSANLIYVLGIFFTFTVPQGCQRI